MSDELARAFARARSSEAAGRELALELAAGRLVPPRESPAAGEGVEPWSAEHDGPGFGRPARLDFDLWYEVPLVPQLTGMSCWAAAAAMIVGWRDRINVEPAEITSGLGAWRAYRAGLLPADVASLARVWGLTPSRLARISVDDLRDLLEHLGPLWLGEADPGLHVVVIAGMFGDGSPDGTWVRVNDPWPVGQGLRYRLSFRRLVGNYESARDLGGPHVQILHTGGRSL